MQLNKKFFIKTLGCKVNQYETQAIREILVRSGFSECLSANIADINIINTCTVTANADKESRHWINLFHRTNPKAKIIVTGCYAENNSDGITFLPGVSHIVKNNEKSRIGEILNREDGKAGDAFAKGTSGRLMISDFKDHAKAFVKIQDGCENFCSYCKVPLVRGVVSSKSIGDTVEEVKALLANGFREIVLTGICLGSWGSEMPANVIAKGVGIRSLGLIDVLKEIAKLAGDFRVRLSSIEPRYVTDELVDFISKNKKMCNHLHIPLQSGDDLILRKMNRPYNSADYRSLVGKIKSAIKDVAITTDVLIGFPGETDDNFRNTLSLIKETLPSRVHIFTFSKRDGTAASNMGDDINRDILKKRHYELKTASLSASYLYRARFLDTALPVLVETKRDKDSGLLTGYSDNYIKVMFDGPDILMKKIIPVKIKYLNLLHTIGVYEPDAG